MTLQLLVSTLLPALLVCIMFGLGLTLTPADFVRIGQSPRAVLVGLAVQCLLLPAIAFGLCFLFALEPQFAIGLMVLAASPGGATSSLYSRMAKGDVALNLTLTTANSALSPVALWLITSFAIRQFAGSDQSIGFHFSKAAEILFLVILPVIAGMALRKKSPDRARRIDRPLQLFSITALAVVVIGAAAKEWALLSDNFAQVGWVMLTFNLLSLAIGYSLPLALKFPKKQSIAIAFEVGVHNSALALFVAITVLGSTAIAVPAAIYGIIMYVTAGLFALLARNLVP